MGVQRLSDDVLNGHTGIQRRIRILEYHLHLLPVGKHVDLNTLSLLRPAV